MHAVWCCCGRSSNRLGQPKQLLLYKGKTLLGIYDTNCFGIFMQGVLVVLGAIVKRYCRN